MTDRLSNVARRLSGISRASQIDMTCHFEWPDEVPTDVYWMSPYLLTVSGTDLDGELSDEQRMLLSQYELLNFFSLNVHLIDELLTEVEQRLPAVTDDAVADFMQDFVREERGHRWFFAMFCDRYGEGVGRIRSTRTAPVTGGALQQDARVFGRILIAEELCDYFNKLLAWDEELPEIVRVLNATHHMEESRHIAFGREMLRSLIEALPLEDRNSVAEYLLRYARVCQGMLYDVNVYRRVGLRNPGRLRASLLRDPERVRRDREQLSRLYAFLGRVAPLDAA